MTNLEKLKTPRPSDQPDYVVDATLDSTRRVESTTLVIINDRLTKRQQKKDMADSLPPYQTNRVHLEQARLCAIASSWVYGDQFIKLFKRGGFKEVKTHDSLMPYFFINQKGGVKHEISVVVSRRIHSMFRRHAKYKSIGFINANCFWCQTKRKRRNDREGAKLKQTQMNKLFWNKVQKDFIVA